MKKSKNTKVGMAKASITTQPVAVVKGKQAIKAQIARMNEVLMPKRKIVASKTLEEASEYGLYYLVSVERNVVTNKRVDLDAKEEKMNRDFEAWVAKMTALKEEFPDFGKPKGWKSRASV